jgi:hypothetical protein
MAPIAHTCSGILIGHDDIKEVGSFVSSRNPWIQTSRATGRMFDEGPRKVPETSLISNKQDKPVSTLRRR